MVTGAMARSKWIAVAVLSATFLAGGMLGAATTRLLGRTAEEPRAERNGEQRHPDRGPRPSVFDRMDLTAEQRAAIDSIMKSRQPDMEAHWKNMRATIDSTSAEINRLLTPEQQEIYQEFRARRRGRPGPGAREGGPPAWSPEQRDQGDRARPQDDSARRPISYQEPQYL